MKLADSHGGMLDAAWEEHAVSLANAPNSKHALALIHTLSDYAKGHHPPPTSTNDGDGRKLPKMVVHIGRDTRTHSPPLAALVIKAARAMGATVIDHGEVSTPMLHHFVMHANGHLLPSAIPQRCKVGIMNSWPCHTRHCYVLAQLGLRLENVYRVHQHW
jgi:phosphoacetylglucosamine mutase